MSSSIPTTTHIVESAVIQAPISDVWSAVSSLNFSFWGLIDGTTPVDASTKSNTVGGTFLMKFRDGVTWTIQLSELSMITNSLTFEVICCEPASLVSSVAHTISLKRITSDNTTFIEWTTDFSNDATAEIISDSQYKRKDALRDLNVALKKA
mmetsp:Transcript_28364/g.28657  ORF Transcript_28364/g.28657 Transcript_28364/m.28657 type:complete len:152 (+) Transcript_28364:153-608(+)|eukprot:CAMPEP_0182428476 /NCGR_PEP_ID=MMETSP1167-20130531/23052_1 /TAXON_ID=2988 /ORGANISM="Mallomonas Sp, Strain CCMP3275" /LENGTH=151 /DNA_ID=CAMNT_0024611411 /DNA_START=145 /DNA_END=600 /DNA_ORIENTATION=+